MSASFVHQLFRLWNLAAATELEVRIQGPLLSFPFGIHYRIVYIDQPFDCGLPCRGNPPKPIDPAHTYPGPLELPTNPKVQVLDKYLDCEYRQLGKKPAWVHDRDNATEVNTYSRCPSAAPGLEWESIWAQYWFNQHHHIQPRPVLRWHPRDWPQDAKPFKKLRLKDCTDRPYFGLHPEIAEGFLNLTARVKGSLVHDGLFHPSTPLELEELCRRANTVNAFKP